MNSGEKGNMMKKLLLATLALLFLTTSAVALPVNTPGYTWSDSQYWTFTDTTTNDGGESTFTLAFEEAAYESDFGLYIVDPNNPKEISKTFKIFDANEIPNGFPLTQKSVNFMASGSEWGVKLGDASEYESFDNVFGFYFGVYINGDYSHTYFSDPFFNTVNQGDQHIAIESDGNSIINIYLDDQISSPDFDWNDMIVNGTDLTAAPVPEPATMLLLGTGLFGVAAFARKRKK